MIDPWQYGSKLCGVQVVYHSGPRKIVRKSERARLDSGVASGYATVGDIGGASRLEYTAVGSPVNLASRLCAEAAHGEVLVDTRTVELVGNAMPQSPLHAGEALQLKGFAAPIQSYVLSPA